MNVFYQPVEHNLVTEKQMYRAVDRASGKPIRLDMQQVSLVEFFVTHLPPEESYVQIFLNDRLFLCQYQSKEKEWKGPFLLRTDRQDDEGKIRHVITLKEWTRQEVLFSSSGESFSVTVPEEQTTYRFVDEDTQRFPELVFGLLSIPTITVDIALQFPLELHYPAPHHQKLFPSVLRGIYATVPVAEFRLNLIVDLEKIEFLDIHNAMVALTRELPYFIKVDTVTRYSVSIPATVTSGGEEEHDLVLSKYEHLISTLSPQKRYSNVSVPFKNFPLEKCYFDLLLCEVNKLAPTVFSYLDESSIEKHLERYRAVTFMRRLAE